MKINCIIQARMGSTRLPGKVWADIGDKTMLEMVYERCSLAKNIDNVVVAWNSENGMVPGSRYKFVDGPEEPAARFVKVLAEYPCDGFVRVCADSPFIDPEMIDGVSQDFDITRHDYRLGSEKAGNRAEMFNTEGFLTAEPSMRGDEREHLGLWFQRRDRLTVDTPADLERARLIVSRMEKPHTEYTAAECLELLRK
jgi:spore coat polysaccharide biosynthesis protein SpsF